MQTIGRRGFTLVELLVALVLLGVVSAGIYRVLLTNQRTYTAQVQRIDLQQNIRAAATILPAEFRELDAVDGDIAGMSADSIRIRAMRPLGFLCAEPALSVVPFAGPTTVLTTLTLRNSPQYGSRDFAANDSILVYYEGDEGSRQDDGWVKGQITQINAPANCAGDGRPGRVFAVRLDFGFGQWNRLHAIQNGSPVRGFEPLTYLLYKAADGRYYIGQRRGTDLQPLVGPVTETGLTLVYYDSTGAVTADPLQVASIEIRVRAETNQPVVRPGGGAPSHPIDSIVTRVALRNNPRW